MIEQVYNVIEELAATSKATEKKKIIEANIDLPYFKEVFTCALHPYKQYNINKLPFLSSEEGNKPKDDEIFAYLDKLTKKRGATNSEIRYLSKLASTTKERWEVVNRVVNKDLRCGVSIKTIRKFIPEIPLHEVMLAESDVDKERLVTNIEPFLKFCGATKDNLEGINWSIKKNGVRTWAVIEAPDSPVRYISRNGKDFENFSIFDDYLKVKAGWLVLNCSNVVQYPVVFDGEVSSSDKDFQKGMTQFRRLKEADPTIFVFDIFDMPKIDALFWSRYKLLECAFGTKYYSGIRALPHYKFDSSHNLEYAEALLDHVITDEEEGLVLKTNDGPYEYKRSMHWYKLIRYYSEDLSVVGVKYGTGRNKDRLGALTCILPNGKKVDVGSGYSDAEREEFIYSPPGMIEVIYKNETKDGSLFHPIFTRVREDKEPKELDSLIN